jgi:hypothetical protein
LYVASKRRVAGEKMASGAKWRELWELGGIGNFSNFVNAKVFIDGRAVGADVQRVAEARPPMKTLVELNRLSAGPYGQGMG